MSETGDLSDYTVAPQHEVDLEELEPYVIEGVAYSPLKMTFLCNYDDSLELRCDSCSWTTTVGELPEDSGRVQPDVCPDCAKAGELGFVRCESPADGTFPSDWVRQEDSLVEELAALEHRQWMHWSKHVAENFDIPEALREKWESNWVPYEALDDDVKDMDRVWARQVMEIVEGADDE